MDIHSTFLSFCFEAESRDFKFTSQGPFSWLPTKSTSAVALSLSSKGQARGSNSRNKFGLITTLKLEINHLLHRVSQTASRVPRRSSAHHTLGSESTPSLNDGFQNPAFSLLDHSRARQWLPGHYCNPLFALPSSTTLLRTSSTKLCLERQGEDSPDWHRDFISMKPIASWIIRSNVFYPGHFRPKASTSRKGQRRTILHRFCFPTFLFKCPLSPSTQWNPYYRCT